MFGQFIVFWKIITQIDSGFEILHQTRQCCGCFETCCCTSPPNFFFLSVWSDRHWWNLQEKCKIGIQFKVITTPVNMIFINLFWTELWFELKKKLVRSCITTFCWVDGSKMIAPLTALLGIWPEWFHWWCKMRYAYSKTCFQTYFAQVFAYYIKPVKILRCIKEAIAKIVFRSYIRRAVFSGSTRLQVRVYLQICDRYQIAYFCFYNVVIKSGFHLLG